MRAALFNGPGRPITIESIADPEPGPGELLVKVCRCGICGSDVSMTGEAPLTLPLGRFGHEYAGEVVEVGGEVQSFRRGDRISALPVAPCGHCEGCRTGNPLFCMNGSFLVGGFGEYMVIPPAAARPLPKSLSFADGALIEPMACGLHALRLARMPRGARVLVIGAGSIALSVIYWARSLGAGKIAVLSRSDHRRDIAMGMGADAVLTFDVEDQGRIVDVLGGAPDIVAECVGKTGMLDLATQHVRRQGVVLSLGMCSYDDRVVPARCTGKEIQLLFPHAYTVDEIAETARAFDSGRVRPDLMVSDVISLEQLPGTLEALRSGRQKSLKVHVDPALRAPPRASGAPCR
jgi:(R,R)-butanediol dehydrogenase/meso-butanediol dehydrogenase/diacetyl reductase